MKVTTPLHHPIQQLAARSPRTGSPASGARFASLMPAATPAATTTTTTPITTVVTKPADAPVATSPAATAPDPPTVESVFGSNPWMASPGGYSAPGGSYSYNPQYFATPETAQKVAQLLGGTVVTSNAMVGNGGPFYQTTPNYMVQLPNGHLVNAGLTATYYTHGWSQAQIDRMLEFDREV